MVASANDRRDGISVCLSMSGSVLEGFQRVFVRATREARTRRVLARRVVANLKLPAHRHGLELHVDRSVAIDERDADAVPVALVVALADDINDLHFSVFHDFVSFTVCEPRPVVWRWARFGEGTLANGVPEGKLSVFGATRRAFAGAEPANGVATRFRG